MATVSPLEAFYAKAIVSGRAAYWSRAAAGSPPPRLPGPVGEVVAGGQGTGVLAARVLLAGAQDLLRQILGGGVVPLYPR
jgi:hypothetical protein